MSAKFSEGPRQVFDYFCVLDFEATCQKVGRPVPQEIIEVPVVLVDAHTLRTVDEFHSYVLPTVHPKLSAFCTELTGITQDMVKDAPPLAQVIRQFNKWRLKHNLKLLPSVPDGGEEEGGVVPCNSSSFCFITCGDWDLKTALPNQLEHFGGYAHEYFKSWCNIKEVFQSCGPVKTSMGMMGMLAKLGIKHQGRHHSGIDDARNIAEITKSLVRDYGAVIKHTSCGIEGCETYLREMGAGSLRPCKDTGRPAPPPPKGPPRAAGSGGGVPQTAPPPSSAAPPGGEGARLAEKTIWAGIQAGEYRGLHEELRRQEQEGRGRGGRGGRGRGGRGRGRGAKLKQPADALARIIPPEIQRYVVNVRQRSKDRDRCEVYVGRQNPQIPESMEPNGDRWGNPIKLDGSDGAGGDRLLCTVKYRDYLISSPDVVRAARKELKGKVLGCWCAPDLCHALILATAANSEGELTPECFSFLPLSYESPEVNSAVTMMAGK